MGCDNCDTNEDDVEINICFKCLDLETENKNLKEKNEKLVSTINDILTSLKEWVLESPSHTTAFTPTPYSEGYRDAQDDVGSLLIHYEE